MQPNNKLEVILFAVPHMSDAGMREMIAIVSAVRWIAEHNCPEGFGTYWHKLCQELVQEC